MKNTFLFIALILGLGLNAQVKFGTGDAELESDLNEINLSAKLDLAGFKNELSVTYGVSSKNIEYMSSINMQPAEMFLALEISAAANKPIELVIDTYEKNRGKGWGVVAQELGIKPGSPEFHALKGNSKSKKEKSNSKVENNAPTTKPGNDNNLNKGNTVDKNNGKKSNQVQKK